MTSAATTTSVDAGGSLDVCEGEGGTIILQLAGAWVAGSAIPDPRQVERRLAESIGVRRLAFDAAGLGEWNSTLLAFLDKLERLAEQRNIPVDRSGLPDGVRRLLELATAVPEKKGARRLTVRETLLSAVGNGTLSLWREGGKFVAFVGEATLSMLRLVSGRARFQSSDLWAIIQASGAQALPIVSLISLLVGLILAFVGAVQLEQFGAQIYVANLVGIAMAREMGAIMAGIIMAGRTGAAFAAQLGTMQVNEEIDALRTFGIEPMDFLVLPRMLALILMMPLLCIYADLLGILGGMIVGIGMLEISPVEYWNQTQGGVQITDFAVGIFKSGVFGVLIAIAGCMRGMQSGRSASAVGTAATSAVVTGIVLIIVTDGLFAVLTNILGI